MKYIIFISILINLILCENLNNGIKLDAISMKINSGILVPRFNYSNSQFFGGAIKELNSFISTETPGGNFTVSCTYTHKLEEFYPSDGTNAIINSITGACDFFIKFMPPSNDSHMWIVTSGKNWIILPFDPSSEWSKFEEFFQLVRKTPPSILIPADSSEKETQDKIDGDVIKSTTSSESTSGEIQTQYNYTPTPGGGPQD